jgi:hypothetical protein
MSCVMVVEGEAKEGVPCCTPSALPSISRAEPKGRSTDRPSSRGGRCDPSSLPLRERDSWHRSGRKQDLPVFGGSALWG